MLRAAVGYFCVFFLGVSVAAAEKPRDVLHDTSVVVDRELVREATATVYVEVHGARGLRASSPLRNARVTVSLVGTTAKAKTLIVATTKTNKSGKAVASFRVPKIEPGSYRLVVHTVSIHGADTVSTTVRLVDKTHLHLRTDRGVYRPGQSIRWRVTALNGANAHPIADQVSITIKDPRGTAIWRGTKTTDDTGMVAGQVPLGDDLVMGSYTLTAEMAGAKATEVVEVKQFRLPAFKVQIEAKSAVPLPRGVAFRGQVVARFTHGEPVAGMVWIKARSNQGMLLNKEVALDAHGRAQFTVPGPADDTSLSISAKVTDGADRTLAGSLVVPIRSDQLVMAIVPDSKNPARGVRQWVTVISTDGAGNLAPAVIHLRVPGRAKRLVKKSSGAVRFAYTPTTRTVVLSASAADGDGRVASTKVTLYAAHRGRRVTVARSVVVAGEPVVIRGRWTDHKGPVIATLLRRGTPIATAIAKIGKGGRFSASIQSPVGVFGLATVRLTELSWDKKNGQQTTSYEQATVYLQPAELDIEITATTRHKPGSNAVVRVQVTDASGNAVANVGLAASVVDERILQLSDPRPDLVSVVRSMDMKKAKAAGIAFAELMKRGDQPSVDLAMRAIIDALPPSREVPTIHMDAPKRFRAELVRMHRAQSDVYALLYADDRRIGVRAADGSWGFRHSLATLLERGKWQKADRVTPWGRPTQWRYARQLLPHWKFAGVAQQVVNERLSKLSDSLLKSKGRTLKLLHRKRTAGLRQLIAKKRISKNLGIDPWGTHIRVERPLDPSHVFEIDDGKKKKRKALHLINIVSAGPDLMFGTNDDITRHDVFQESDSYGGIGYGYGTGSGYGGGSGRGSIGLGHYRTIGHGGGSAVDVAIRKRFDETVLWIAGARTDDRGRARFDVPLADSITGWEVVVEALSAEGAIGWKKSRLETFLPLYVDVDVPTRLSTGDRYGLSAIVANHSKKSRTLKVTLEVSARLEELVRRTARVTLPAGTTRALLFPIKAVRAGEAFVQFKLFDESGVAVDAIKRSLTIEPPGALVRELRPGTVEDGKGRFVINIADNAVAGTVRGRIRLFRGAADQAVDGIEGLLREPYGCFEQTSSSTYPNLLVLQLLKNAPGTEAVRARAEKLVGKGYQRLISYEVTGGGFSWFGHAPANQVLTAYGLMEFVDMAKVYPVDDALIDRTRTWLLSKQAKDGSWSPDKSWLHDWSAVQGKLSTTIYIAWALAESGYRGKPLDRALAFIDKHHNKVKKDPYLLATWAAAESAIRPGVSRPLRTLSKLGERVDGKLTFSAAGKTLFYASGKGADLQVTAMATAALSRAGPKHSDDTADALAAVWAARSPNYGWGTTQGTVLALRAAALSAKPAPKEGSLTVRLDGKTIGIVDLAQPGIPTVELPSGLRPGKHVITVSGEVGGVLSADLRVSWRESGEPSALVAGLAVTLQAPVATTRLGENVKLVAKIANPGKEVVPMPTVILPVPPGFRADRDSLEALVKARKISKFEDQGSEIQLYMEKLAPGASVSLPYELEAIAQNRVGQRPARAYAYYDPATRGSSVNLALRANARKSRSPTK